MRRRRHVEEGSPLESDLLLRLMLTQRLLAGDPAQAKNARKIAERLPSVLGRATVLVAADTDGHPLIGTGLQRARILRVFTDNEAFTAWTAERPPDEPAAAPLVVGDLPVLDQVLREGAVTTMVLNVAGPGGSAVPADVYAKRAAPLVRAPVDFEDHAWLGPDGRSEERRRLADVLDRLGTAVDADDETWGSIVGEANVGAGGSFSDLISLGRILWLGSLRAEHRNGATSVTAKLYLVAAARMGMIGETARCLQALVAAGRILSDMIQAGDEQGDWATTALRAVAADAERLAGADHPAAAALRSAAGAPS